MACGKGYGAPFSKITVQKAPLFLATWTHQAPYVNTGGLARQSADQGASEKRVPVRPASVPVPPEGEAEAAGNFPGTHSACTGLPLTQARWHRGQGARWALFHEKPKREESLAYRSPSPWLLPLDLPFISPTGRTHPRWVLWKLWVC